MGTFTLGHLTSVPVSAHPELVAAPTLRAIEANGLVEEIGVVEIDPDVTDTARSQEQFNLPPDSLANCVVVAGKRTGEERIAACLVLATTRADVNRTVRLRMDVKKASFLPMDRAVDLTGMEYGGITPVGLPANWPIFVDSRVLDQEVIVIGSGVRRSKLLLTGALVPRLPGVEVVDGLGTPIAEG